MEQRDTVMVQQIVQSFMDYQEQYNQEVMCCTFKVAPMQCERDPKMAQKITKKRKVPFFDQEIVAVTTEELWHCFGMGCVVIKLLKYMIVLATSQTLSRWWLFDSLRNLMGDRWLSF